MSDQAQNQVSTLFAETLGAAHLSKKQQAVLNASLTLFASRGFDNTSTLDIAKRAGVSEGTVFKRFKTKDGLLQAVLQPFLRGVLPRELGAFVAKLQHSDSTHFADMLRFALRDRVEFVMANRNEMRVFIQEMVKDPTILSGLTTDLEALLRQAIDPLFAQYQAAGELVTWDSMRIARYITGTLLSYLLPNVVMSTAPLAVEQVCDECAEFLLAGLTPPAGTTPNA